MKSFSVLFWLMLLSVFLGGKARADGSVVDKVYHPYVQPLEQEIEYRFNYQKQANHPEDNWMAQKLGYGHSISDRFALEGYIIAERITPDDYHVRGYEIEARWMLTEQGEYSADWGLMFEFEKLQANDSYETSAALLMEKEFGPTSLTLNAVLVYEWGKQMENEFETQFRAQYRYRWLPEVQPALEVYMGQGFHGAGPSLMGVHKFTSIQQLKWEAAVIFAIDNATVNNTLRFALEYEF